jgi:dihydrofolate synthase/folylpolyglutamate synthase
VRSAPTILLDAAHNPHGMTATVKALTEEFSFNRLVVVLATLADKDATGMLELLEPITEAVVCTRNTSPRAMPAERLGDLAEAVLGGDRVRVEPFLPDAIETAVAIAESDVDSGFAGVGILITGSVITVADARMLLVR